MSQSPVRVCTQMLLNFDMTVTTIEFITLEIFHIEVKLPKTVQSLICNSPLLSKKFRDDFTEIHRFCQRKSMEGTEA